MKLLISIGSIIAHNARQTPIHKYFIIFFLNSGETSWSSIFIGFIVNLILPCGGIRYGSKFGSERASPTFCIYANALGTILTSRQIFISSPVLGCLVSEVSQN